MSDVLVQNVSGNYSFIRGIAPYSGGVIAAEGFEIVHARFLRPVALAAGFEALQQHLAAAGRPIQAVCGIELRSPAPFTFQGFSEFNSRYVGALKELGIITDGVNPVARTNVAPQVDPPTEPALYGFSYTIQTVAARKTFVVAGGGELPEGSLEANEVIRLGETSADAIREKARFVAGLMSGRLEGLGVSWSDATQVNIYTVHAICDFVADDVVGRMSACAVHGLTWHYSRPPIVSIEYEMDLRGTDREIVLSRP